MVPTVTVRKQYACNNSVVEFVFDIVFFETTDLVVEHLSAAGVKTTLVETDDYSVSGDEVSGRYPDGGTVTTVATYPTGDTITITREIPLTQLVDYSIYRSLPQEIQETVVDQLTCMVQQFHDYLDRSLYFPTVDPTTISGELPKKADRLNKYLKFHETTGEPEAVAVVSVVGITDFIKTLIDDVDAAEALTTLGVTAFIQTLFDDADADAFLATLVADAAGGAAGFKVGITSIHSPGDADYLILDDDGYTDFLFALVTSDRTLTLPTAAENTGREVYVKIISNTSGMLWIDGEGAERINGILGGWALQATGDWIHLICDGSDWHVKGHYETELIYWHETDFQQGSPAQNTWYAITNFQLALPTGGVWEIKYGSKVWAEMTGTVVASEATCADGAASEDDDKYTIQTGMGGEHVAKSFRRTFAAAATLYMNCRVTIASVSNLRASDADSSGWLSARRVA